jgi:hypothetical protein
VIAMNLTNTTDNRLDIKFNLSNPEGCIEAANKNVKRIMPKLKVNEDPEDTIGVISIGVINTGAVKIEMPGILKSKKKVKNTRKDKQDKQR